jgi:hypothetical protein
VARGHHPNLRATNSRSSAPLGRRGWSSRPMEFVSPVDAPVQSTVSDTAARNATLADELRIRGHRLSTARAASAAMSIKTVSMHFPAAVSSDQLQLGSPQRRKARSRVYSSTERLANSTIRRSPLRRMSGSIRPPTCNIGMTKANGRAPARSPMSEASAFRAGRKYRGHLRASTGFLGVG